MSYTLLTLLQASFSLTVSATLPEVQAQRATLHNPGGGLGLPGCGRIDVDFHRATGRKGIMLDNRDLLPEPEAVYGEPEAVYGGPETMPDEP